MEEEEEENPVEGVTMMPFVNNMAQTNDDVLHEDINDDNADLSILYEDENAHKTKLE